PPASFDPANFADASPEVAGGAAAAIAIGGDGTLRAVAERLGQIYPRDRVPPLVVVPMGTANLMGTHLDHRWKRQDIGREIADALDRRQVAYLDAGRANGSLFLLMASAGFDAGVVHEMERVRTGPIEFYSYALPTALTLKDYAYPPITVTVDGRHVFGPAPGHAIIANVPEYGVGFPFLPKARPDDELLDVCVLPCRSRAALIKIVLRAAVGEHLQDEGAVFASGRSIRIDPVDADVPVQLDGDAFGTAPLQIDLLPHHVPFIVPR
ncbi:MAG TPA: diacylglycerol kinase family protein, partial [Tepidisphaeraceae bacterium]|nr:diacylglycerol kinase family protein [Tepidisphaeraceae bacterium]